jgi:hypothetical protein
MCFALDDKVFPELCEIFLLRKKPLHYLLGTS